LELVYLWVEDYKNIQKQGFNFSPRFTCDYDGKELTIKENDDYIENFFGDNINVTAIVGKNGSGKSTICELLNSPLPNLQIVYFLNNVFYSKFKINIVSTEQYKVEKLYINDEFYDKNITTDFSNCNNIESDNCKLLIIGEVLESDGSSFDFLNEDFIFTDWYIRFSNISNLNIGIEKYDEEYNLIYSTLLKNENERYLKIFVFVTIKFIQYILAKKSLKESKYWNLINNLSKTFTKENYFKLVNSIELERLNFIGNYSLILETLKEYDKSVRTIKKIVEKQKIYKNDIQKFIKSGIYITFNSFSKNYFNEQIIQINYSTKKDVTYLDLSSGEQQRIINNALLIHSIINFENADNICIIDEPDMYLHPNWQKLIINDFLKILKKYLKNYLNIHLVITSHSPFLVSDLSKGNIIFLKEGKQVKGTERKQTFGANIHTLLSDSFFMEDGLMGEFAKSKIDEVIEYLNGKKDTKIKNDDEAQKLVNIIGEPIVKNQLQRMLDSKRLKKVDEIDIIKENMIAMQQRLDELEK
jgi:predicted ATP-binding protein involved in virulence